MFILIVKNRILLLFITLFVSFLLYFSSIAFAKNCGTKLLVQGNQRISTSVIKSFLPKNICKINARELSNIEKNLYQTGYFSSIKVKSGTKLISIKVKENPIINSIVFTGNKDVKNDQLQKAILSKSGYIYRIQNVIKDEDTIVSLYHKMGFYKAIVEPRITRLAHNRIDLYYNITENTKAVIGKITFEGNSNYTQAKLKEIIFSKESRWYRFGSSDVYSTQVIDYDKFLLTSFYVDHGFIDFTIAAVRPILKSNNKYLNLIFSISEGERYKIKGINLSTDIKSINKEAIDKILTPYKDQIFNSSKLNELVTSVQNQLKKQDILANVYYNYKKVDKNLVDVTLHVKRFANPAIVSLININGNFFTQDQVVRRELPIQEKDILTSKDIALSKNAILKLGYFDKADINPVLDANGSYILNIDLHEIRTGKFMFSGTYSTLNAIGLGATVSQRNFLGTGDSVDLSFSIDKRAFYLSLSAVQPYFLGSQLFATWSIYNNIYTYDNYKNKVKGFSFGLGYNLSKTWSQQGFYSLSMSNIFGITPPVSIDVTEQKGSIITSSFGQTISYNTLNNNVNPTSGTLASMTNTLAGFGGNQKFLKNVFEYTFYQEFTGNTYTKVHALLGDIHVLQKKPLLTINNRFNSVAYALRGFDYGGYGPRDIVGGDALGGKRIYKLSLDLFFPLGFPRELGINGDLFTDWGAIKTPVEKTSSLHYTGSFRATMGVGVVWRSPMGPIQFIFAKSIKKEPWDRPLHFQIIFGTNF